MKEPIDREAFGRRVRECREDLDWPQEYLGELTGYSQTNIGWIESGGPKRPQRVAPALAAAMGTTSDWLLYGMGPRWSRPGFIAPSKLKEKYSLLTTEQKSFISQYINEAAKAADKTRSG